MSRENYNFVAQLESSGVKCFQVNAPGTFGQKEFSVGEFTMLFFRCLQAIWIRCTHSVKNFYYVPASGARASLYRDWFVMLLCRPFFKHLILHWQEPGMARWLETSTTIYTRSFTFNRLKNASLSFVAQNHSADAEKMLPVRIEILDRQNFDFQFFLKCLLRVENAPPDSDFKSRLVPGLRLRDEVFAAPKLKLALTILAENPKRKTGLTSMFHELVARALKLFPEVSWIIFAGPEQKWDVDDSRVEIVRDFPANDHLARRLFADHFFVSAEARRRGAHALLTVGFVPLRKKLPAILHVLSLQTLDKKNRLGRLRNFYRNSLMKHNWPQADLVIVNSRWTAEQVLSAKTQFEKRMIVSYEGLQHEIFHPQSAPGELEQLKRKFGLQPGYFLWISNFYPYKQAELLIAAYVRLAPQIRRQHPLVLAGGNWLNGLEIAQAQAKSLGVEAEVKFLGWIDDEMVAPLYRHAAAFCLASREETFGRCVIEAMACGTPCIVNDIPIMHEITGDHALILDFRDANAVANALEKIVNDSTFANHFRDAGQAYVQRFTFENLVTERITAIRKLVEHSQSSLRKNSR
jgi:glycosyltransferase involved in cell wall biosynthesis